ncbi:MAG TPA: CcmD family protein [Terriglobales bacterium]|jgi:CcmD family protein|nr:CcmD family protein [Terriglobales bacterium]
MIRSITNLYIAYAATWVIHIGYLLFLGAKAKKLREEARELGLLTRDPS